MAVKNLEKTVVDRIVTQLNYIDGSTNYNNTLASANINSSYKDVTECDFFPYICISPITFSPAEMFIRDAFEIDMEVPIWGYVKSEHSALDDALKLLSDIRVAITTDEWLNRNITNMSFSAQTGAYQGIGVVLFTVTGKINSQF